jgi:hypothetical protein
MITTLSNTATGWTLAVDDAPFFVKGAVGYEKLARLAELGANAVRLPALNRDALDEAHAAGLAVLANLRVRPERDGMNYDDEAAVATQHRELMRQVAELKDHPAIFMWCVGNELDHIPGNTDFNPKVWPAVNAIAREIHVIDPDHPTMTAVGMGRFGKVAGVVDACPDLDLIGINAYADIDRVDGLLGENGWTKPYLFTEWGMSGMWQRPKTPWGAAFEESTSVKAEDYRRRYRTAILEHPDRCLGGFAFYWGWRHENTLSWYNTWDPDGREMETVEVWRELFTGEPADPRLPHLYGVRLNRFIAPDPVIVEPGERVPLEALADENAALPGMRLSFEVRPEVEYGAYAGSGEVLPEVVPGCIDGTDGLKAVLRAPGEPGAYRVFAYLSDSNERFATANLPFHVGPW